MAKTTNVLKPILTNLASVMAEETPYDGITVSDLRAAAEDAGILTGREKGRELSFLGSVMKDAGLVPTPRYRRSGHKNSHGNLHRVFRAAA